MSARQFEFELEQYRALRAEVIQSMSDGNKIAGFGLAAIGLLVNAAIASSDTFLGFFILAVMLPLLSALVVSLWFAAQERLARAGHFLTGIEARLSEDPAVGWGHWLRSRDGHLRSNHFWYTEISGITLFFALAACALGASFAIGGGEPPIGVRIAIVLLSGAFVAAMLVHLERRSRRVLGWFSDTFDPAAGPPRDEAVTGGVP